MKKKIFLVKGTIDDNTYSKLLQEKALDARDRQLNIADEVAYQIKSTYSANVPFGEIKEIWLEYGLSWVSTPTATSIKINYGNYEPNYNQINCFLKVGNVTRSSKQVVRLA